MKTDQKVGILLQFNPETLRLVLNHKHGAALVFSNKRRADIEDISDDIVRVLLNGTAYEYQLSGGSIIGEHDESFCQNYGRLRVLTFWDSVEEFKASDLYKYNVSRHIKRAELPQGGIVTGDGIFEKNVNKGERVVVNYEGLRKTMTGEQKQEERQRTDGYLQYLNEFRGLYKDLAERQNTTLEIAVTAIVVSIAASITSIIALIVATV